MKTMEARVGELIGNPLGALGCMALLAVLSLLGLLIDEVLEKRRERMKVKYV